MALAVIGAVWLPWTPAALFQQPVMPALRAIVTATDLSAPSRHAAWRAAMLARASGAALTLVHSLRETALDGLRRWPANSPGARASPCRPTWRPAIRWSQKL
jgi:hypothetical protein